MTPAQWATVWARFAERARLHLASLDPRTDWLPILRWHGRWLRALRRAQDAAMRAATEKV